MDKTDLIIIGAGPGGIQAAITAAKFGLEVTLIDSQPTIGGQYYKQIPEKFSSNVSDYHHQQATQLISNIKISNVKILINTLVWGIFFNPKTDLWQLTLHGENCPSRLESANIIIATGAFDRSIPFPGWDLPGVITAGAAQVMVKNQGILPGRNVVVSGTGPLQLAAASNLIEAGANVLAVLESNQNLLFRGLPYISSIWGQWRRMEEGFQYAGNLIKSKTPFRIGWSIVKAEGSEKVEAVTIAKLDSDGNPIQSTYKTMSADSVVIGYGLTPSTEFFRLLNVDMFYSESQGVYLPVRNEFFQTSLSGIYAIGDCAGIGGAKMAMLEGKVAALDIAKQSGQINPSNFGSSLSHIKRDLNREKKFARMLGDVFSIPQGLFSLAQDDTIICRCEQISLSEIYEAISFGTQSVTDIKNITRAGMGNCQGRTCGSILAQILAKETHNKLEDCHFLNIRPPVHPVPIEIIEEETSEVLS